MDEKPAVGVSHAFVQGKPRVLVALYLDAPEIQLTVDSEGRKIALATFDPDAAHVTLSNKINEAYDALRSQQLGTGEPIPYKRPYVSMAAVCEKILDEKDGVISLIRIVDNFNVTSNSEQRMAVNVRGVVQFRGGPETFPVELTCHAPDGAVVAKATSVVPLDGRELSAHHLVFDIPVLISGDGTYVIKVHRDQELLRQLPFHLTLRLAQSEQTPSGTRLTTP